MRMISKLFWQRKNIALKIKVLFSKVRTFAIPGRVTSSFIAFQYRRWNCAPPDRPFQNLKINGRRRAVWERGILPLSRMAVRAPNWSYFWKAIFKYPGFVWNELTEQLERSIAVTDSSGSGSQVVRNSVFTLLISNTPLSTLTHHFWCCCLLLVTFVCFILSPFLFYFKFLTPFF